MNRSIFLLLSLAVVGCSGTAIGTGDPFGPFDGTGQTEDPTDPPSKRALVEPDAAPAPNAPTADAAPAPKPSDDAGADAAALPGGETPPVPYASAGTNPACESNAAWQTKCAERGSFMTWSISAACTGQPWRYVEGSNKSLVVFRKDNREGCVYPGGAVVCCER